MKIGDAVAIINLAENQAQKFEDIVDNNTDGIMYNISKYGIVYNISKQELDNTANILRKLIRLIEDREI